MASHLQLGCYLRFGELAALRRDQLNLDPCEVRVNAEDSGRHGQALRRGEEQKRQENGHAALSRRRQQPNRTSE